MVLKRDVEGWSPIIRPDDTATSFYTLVGERV